MVAGPGASAQTGTAGTGGAATGAYRTPASQHHHGRDALTPALAAEQSRLLTDATRLVQEHAYYMKQAIEGDDLPMVMDVAAPADQGP